MGLVVGSTVGDDVGAFVGDTVGDTVGDFVGLVVGCTVGDNVGAFVGHIVGDTVGDPLKDTSGPALNILMKLMAILSLVLCDFFMSINNGTGWFAIPRATTGAASGF